MATNSDSSKQRKTYTPEQKLKIVMESYQRDTTIEAVRIKYGVAGSVLHRWRDAFKQAQAEVALSAFGDKRNPKSKAVRSGYEPGQSPDELKKIIGEQTVQIEILKKSSGAAGLTVRQKIAAAAAFTDPDSPAFDRNMQPVLTKSLLARTLGFSRHSYYYRPTLPQKDSDLAGHIRRIYKDDDDTLGAKKLAKQLSQELGGSKPVNHKRVARVMRTRELSSRPKKAKYRYPGRTAEPFTNLTRAVSRYEIALHPLTGQAPEVLRSDILEGRLADGSKVYITFAWRETTAQVLSLVIDWRMQADLIVATLSRIPEQLACYLKYVIWHTD